MAKQKARKSRTARAAIKGLSLNAHRTAIIVGLISTFGVLAASAISNWDKLRGSQAPDVTGDLLAYNEQRRAMVEGAFNQAIYHVEEVEKTATDPEAKALRDFAVSVRENKAKVQRQYDKVLGAIKDKKPVQAEINKTELNTIIVDTQRGYDGLRASLGSGSEFKIRGQALLPSDPQAVALMTEMFNLGKGVTGKPKLPLPVITFPIGRNGESLLLGGAQYIAVAHDEYKSCEKGQAKRGWYY